ANVSAQAVWRDNAGDVITAFQQSWTDGHAPVANLTTGARGAVLIGAGLMIAGGIVLVLKINVIVQLILLAIQIAQAIATAVATCGGALLEIPILQRLSKLALDQSL